MIHGGRLEAFDFDAGADTFIVSRALVAGYWWIILIRSMIFLMIDSEHGMYMTREQRQEHERNRIRIRIRILFLHRAILIL